MATYNSRNNLNLSTATYEEMRVRYVELIEIESLVRQERRSLHEAMVEVEKRAEVALKVGTLSKSDKALFRKVLA